MGTIIFLVVVVVIVFPWFLLALAPLIGIYWIVMRASRPAQVRLWK